MPQRRWNYLLAALCLLTLATAHRVPLMATLLLMIACGATLIMVIAARVTSETWLRRVALGNFAVGISVGIGLYAVSQLPGVLSSAWVIKPGFWGFSGDAVYYHQIGCQIADALRHQVPFPGLDLTYGGNFHVVVGLLYLLLGSHPLVVIFCNAVLYALMVVMTYRIVALLSHPRAARIAAVCVACWPSAFAWSSQLMKDTLTNTLMVGVLALILPLISPGRLKHALLRLLSLFTVVFILFFFREYLTIGLGLAALATIGVLAARRILRGRELVRAVLAVGLTAASIASVQQLGPDFFIRLLNPQPSAVHVFQLGAAHEAKGERVLAIEAYRQALALKEDFTPAYLNLGLLLAREGQIAEARQALQRFLELNPGDYSAAALREIVQILQGTIDKRMPPQAIALALDQGLERGNQLETIIATSLAAVSGQEKKESEIATAVQAAPPEALLSQLEAATAGLNRMTGRWMIEPLAGSTNDKPAVKSRFVTSKISPETIGGLRRGFVVTGGDSLLTNTVPSKTTLRQVIGWVPSAFAAVLFSPYPWHWADPQGRLVPFRVLAGLESLTVLLLLPAACLGGWGLIRSVRRPAGIVLAWLFVVLAMGVGTTVVNAGTLFRLRLPVLMPFLFMAGLGLDHPWWEKVRSRCRRPWQTSRLDGAADEIRAPLPDATAAAEVTSAMPVDGER